MSERYFTAETTAFTIPKRGAVAIVCGDMPKRNDNGTTSYSLRFPCLLVPDVVSDAEGFAEKVAAVLNENADRFFSSAAKATGTALVALALFSAPSADAGETGYPDVLFPTILGQICLTANPDGGCSKPLPGWVKTQWPGDRDECVVRLRPDGTFSRCRGSVAALPPEPPIQPIPLPAGLPLLLGALAGLGFLRRRARG